MTQAATIIAGHSHITALGVPLKSTTGTNELVAIAGTDAFVGFTGMWPRASDYWEALSAASSGRTLALSWRGNQHMSEFLLARSPKIDFVLSDRVDLPVDEAATIVPELALRELYLPFLAGLRALLPTLTAKQVFVLATPPPKDDDGFCRKHLRKEPAFGKIAERLGVDLDTVQFTAPLIRLKHWSLLQRMMREAAREQNAIYVPPPQGAQDESGFLKRELWAEDVSHANAAYGKSVLAQLSTLL